MMILAAAAGFAASAVIYAIEDLADKSICKAIAKKKAVQQPAPVVPTPNVNSREAELEAQIAQLQAALVQQQPAPQPQQAAVVQQPAPQPVQVVTVAAPVEEVPPVGFKKGDKVVLSDTATAIQGQLPPNEKTCVIDKINDDGTMVVIFRIGNSRRRCTVSEYDVFPAD